MRILTPKQNKVAKLLYAILKGGCSRDDACKLMGYPARSYGRIGQDIRRFGFKIKATNGDALKLSGDHVRNIEKLVAIANRDLAELIRRRDAALADRAKAWSKMTPEERASVTQDCHAE